MATTLAKRTKQSKSTWQDVESLKDVLADILSRLPAQDLLQYRAVSPHWNSVILSPYFAEKQLSFAKKDPVFIILPYIGKSIDVYLINSTGDVLEEINIPDSQNLSLFRIKCVCNGLVCFMNCPYELDEEYDEDDIFNNEVNGFEVEIRICNPCTRELVLLPQGNPSKGYGQMGIAFGPGMAEYKVYRIYYLKSEANPDDLINMCEVYTPSSGTWRGIGRVPASSTFLSSVFLDGKVYWFLGPERDSVIPDSLLMVDMDDHFSTMKLPMKLTKASFLTELAGRLCIVCIFYDERVMRIWLLKDENLGHSWEIHSVGIPFTDPIVETNAVAGRKNDIFVATSRDYYIYNIESWRWTKFDFSKSLDMNAASVFPFTGSLLPCNGVLGPQY